ncbi:MAG: alkaline phosphatase family protein, partial [Deltaproteobacteria bacterium]|nr:alkaline phosphatase family protein [Deltaproteobacteria bacterium]
MRNVVAAGLLLLATAAAVVLGQRALDWNDQLVLDDVPLARTAPLVDDPHTPALSRRVIVVILDGLGAGEAKLPFLDELRARGVAAVARVPYPTLSRPNYVTILTGVPPRDSGVRTNRVPRPVTVDTLMDRVQGAGKRTASASTYGVMVSLFVRNAPSVGGIQWIEDGTRVRPPPPITWPLDEVHRVPELAPLGPTIAALARTDAALISVLVLDIDRAGHKSGVGEEYRAAARDADAMLRVAFAGLDLARDTVIVTADHGHVAPGGHGGLEDEVRHVPLV